MQHELRGIELVRIIFQIVLAVAFFKGIFSETKFYKNYKMLNMFYFTMISFVISRLSCFRLAEIRRKRSSMKVLFIF